MARARRAYHGGRVRRALEAGVGSEVLARAHIVAVDDAGQTARIGELHHAIDAGVRSEADVVTLGALVDGATGRAREDEITVADLTGVGVQDAAIAALVLRRAIGAGVFG